MEECGDPAVGRGPLVSGTYDRLCTPKKVNTIRVSPRVSPNDISPSSYTVLQSNSFYLMFRVVQCFAINTLHVSYYTLKAHVYNLYAHSQSF